MRLQRRFMAVFLSMLLLCMMGMTVYAHDVPDDSRTGTVSITMVYEEKAVPGGTMTFYRVGEIREDDGNYSFILSSDFIGSGADLSEPSKPELADKLARYAEEQNFAGVTEKIGNDGKVIFTGVETGLYLMVQHEAADGYNKVSPFLISIPMSENGTYIYDVDASPKMELKKVLEQTPSKPSMPSQPAGPTLPQTGQLNWPIPMLAVSGLLMFSIGWLLRFGKKRGSYEK